MDAMVPVALSVWTSQVALIDVPENVSLNMRSVRLLIEPFVTLGIEALANRRECPTSC
jgi:hypothetical protein